MKKTLIYLAIFITTNLYAEKNARLIISENNSNDLKFLSYIKVIGQDTIYYKNMGFTKDALTINDIKKGKYEIKFYSIFNDSITSQIEISKKQKYNVNFQGFSFYTITENIDEFCEKSRKTDKIVVYVFTRVGDLSWYSQIIYLNKDYSYYFKRIYGLDMNEHSDENVFSRETYNEGIKSELYDFIILSKNSETSCGDLFRETISQAIIMINNSYLEFSFCPEKHNELDNITKTLKDNSEKYKKNINN